jgi:hypothetical protein
LRPLQLVSLQQIVDQMIILNEITRPPAIDSKQSGGLAAVVDSLGLSNVTLPLGRPARIQQRHQFLAGKTASRTFAQQIKRAADLLYFISGEAIRL